MKVIQAGHTYRLNHLDGTNSQELQFVNRGHGCNKEGTNNQEVLRVLIDRVKFLELEKSWHGNERIIHHLRMALVLHESRHLERLVERRLLFPEYEPTGEDGHFSKND